jgi:hypothetical protein
MTIILENKVLKNCSCQKMSITEKAASKLIFFNEKKN